MLTDARRPARTGPDGNLVLLAEQDRSRWDRVLIDEGVGIISDALATAPLGPYQLQAAIAAVHAEATDARDTDWRQIVALYDLLDRMTPNPGIHGDSGAVGLPAGSPVGRQVSMSRSRPRHPDIAAPCPHGLREAARRRRPGCDR